MLKLALVQMACSDEIESNIAKAVAMIDKAAAAGAQVVALQEIFNSPYFPNRPRDQKYFDLAEPIPGPTVDRVAEKARAHGVTILAPIYEKEMSGVYYNSAVLIGPDGNIVGKYRKMHIPHSEHLIEKFYFKPGNLGFPVFSTPHGKIGTLICYDRHFPEGARILGLGGAELVLVPVASPRPQGREVFVKELMAMAIANQYFVAAVNRVGPEAADTFFGGSLVCDPRGNVIAQASDKGDEVLVVDIDLAQVVATRNSWLFYRDRRPDAYGGLIG
jgi:N-carbamoylputrescine amidase